MFVEPTQEVYEGMIVAENARDNDMPVNPTTAKKLTNMRTTSSDENIILKPARKMTLEQALEYIEGGRAGRGDAEQHPAAEAAADQNARKKAGRRPADGDDGGCEAGAGPPGPAVNHDARVDPWVTERGSSTAAAGRRSRGRGSPSTTCWTLPQARGTTLPHRGHARGLVRAGAVGHRVHRAAPGAGVGRLPEDPRPPRRRSPARVQARRPRPARPVRGESRPPAVCREAGGRRCRDSSPTPTSRDTSAPWWRSARDRRGASGGWTWGCRVHTLRPRLATGRAGRRGLGSVPPPRPHPRDGEPQPGWPRLARSDHRAGWGRRQPARVYAGGSGPADARPRARRPRCGAADWVPGRDRRTSRDRQALSALTKSAV